MSLCFELSMVLCHIEVVVGGEEGVLGDLWASQLVQGISRMNTMNDVSKG